MYVAQLNSNQQVQNIGKQQIFYSASVRLNVQPPRNHK